MNKKTFLITATSVLTITLTSGVLFKTVSQAGNNLSYGQDLTTVSTTFPGSTMQGSQDSSSDYTYIPPTLASNNSEVALDPLLPIIDEQQEVPFVPNTQMDLDPASITVFVNKEYSLPKDYKPVNMVVPNIKFNLSYYDERTLMRSEAAEALEELFEAAKAEGHTICGISGYRSYQRQYNIFTNNITNRGKAYTLKYSAVPGTSEHQTGLAIDVSCTSLNYKLSSTLASLPEGIWLAENAHDYGYIIRYPKGKSNETGYAYEPWHIRYVGKELATHLYTNGLTLDEYYNYTPSENFNFEVLYADLINFIPPRVTVIPMDGDGVIVGENGEIIEGTDQPVTDDQVKPTKPPKKEEELPVTPIPADTEDPVKDPITPGENGNSPTPKATPTPTPAPTQTPAPTPTSAPIPTIVPDQTPTPTQTPTQTPILDESNASD